MILLLFVLVNFSQEISPDSFIFRMDLSGYQNLLETRLKKFPKDYEALTLLSFTKSCSVYPWAPDCIENEKEALQLANRAIQLNPKYFLSYIARYSVTEAEADLKMAKALNPEWPYLLRLEANRAQDNRDFTAVGSNIDAYLRKDNSQYTKERAATALCNTPKWNLKDSKEIENLANRGLRLLKNKNWWEINASLFCIHSQQFIKAAPFTRKELEIISKAEKNGVKSKYYYRLLMDQAFFQKDFKTCAKIGNEAMKKFPHMAAMTVSCIVRQDGINEKTIDEIKKYRKLLKNGEEEELLISIYLQNPFLMKEGFTGIRKLYEKRARYEKKYSVAYYNKIAEMFYEARSWSVDPIELYSWIQQYMKSDPQHRYLKSPSFLGAYMNVDEETNRRTKDIIEVFDKWIKIDPTNSDLKYNQLILKLSDNSSHLEEAEEFVKKLPEDSMDRLGLEVRIAQIKKDHQKELESLRKMAVQNLSPTAIGAFLSKVEDLKGPKQALKEFDKLAEETNLNKESADMLIQVAYYRYQVGDRKKALELLEKAEAKNPYNAMVLANLSIYYAKAKQCDKAIDYAKRAAKRAAVFDRIGRTLENMQFICGGPELKFGYMWELH